MGDRTTCTLYVTGTVTQSQFDAIAKAITGYDGFIEFEGVNYGRMPEPLAKALEAADVTYCWINEPGSCYPGAILAHCDGKTVEFPMTDGDVMIPVCSLDHLDTLQDARFAQDVHDRLTGDGLSIST